MGEQDGRALLVIEFLEGTTLRHRIAGRPLEMDLLLALAIGAARIEVGGPWDWYCLPRKFRLAAHR